MKNIFKYFIINLTVLVFLFLIAEGSRWSLIYFFGLSTIFLIVQDYFGMKKIFKYAAINTALLIFILFTAEVSIWFFENAKMQKKGVFPPSIQRLSFHPGIKNFSFDPQYFPTPENGYGRSPEGLEYNKKPIVIFGCSFAYGYRLAPEQTFSYKLAHYAKMPVYNRAQTGWGIQHMLYQTKIDKIYEQIPEPQYVIYVFIDDHIKRLYATAVSEWNIISDEQNLRYKEKNGHLIEIKNTNPILRRIKRLYLVNEIHRVLVQKYISNPKNNKSCIEFALKHFIEAKAEMQQRWKDTKYIVLLYSSENEYLKTKLEENGFTVIKTSELTNENLNSPQYMRADLHPTEQAWDIIVPELFKKLN